ncbi:hypothetical protein LCGC14_0930770 [marine sediment metagenome]|uniref:Anti-bacteriophage protein A/HamA C-terminal domain-containing protein n=1 Tax=marine sediment metagenome TaxID=412755 RepID=A0A0F9RUJ7_9ZZZZ
MSILKLYSLIKESIIVSEPLNKWLSCCYRTPCRYIQFRVIDIQEQCVPNEEIKSFISSSLAFERFDPSFIQDMVRELGWESIAEEIIESNSEDLSSFHKGDIGEMFFSVILREFHNYTIPVPKLRSKMITAQSQPRTDILALKIDQNNTITEVCYFEVKLRTTSDNYSATDSYLQLMDAFNSRTPSIIKFVASRLYELNDPLCDNFFSYLTQRRISGDIDNFQIGLCYEKENWDEKVLENLEDTEIELPNLTTQILQIENLRALLNDIFNDSNEKKVSNHK